MRLKEKVALITGAGSGIGREAALRFAEEGAKIVVADVNDAAQRTVRPPSRCSASWAAFRSAWTVRIGVSLHAASCDSI